MKDYHEVEGWLFDEEAELLQKYTKLTDYDIIELGVYKGKSTCAINPYKNVNSWHYAIDTFDGRATTKECNTLQEFLDNTKEAPVIVYIGSTNDFIKVYINNYIGLLFIDADHTYDAVKEDFNNYINNVVLNGYIIFHDAYGEDGPNSKTIPWKGVYDFCQELQKDDRVKLVESVRRCAVFQRIR